MDVPKISTVALAILFIMGCSSGQNADSPGVTPPGATAPGAAAPPPAKTVFDPLTQQVERARDVQKTVDQNADNTRKAVDSQERGDSSP
jgi:hypothetical protein